MAYYALIVLHLLYPCIFFVFCHAEVKCPTRFRSVFDICIHIGPHRNFCKAQEYCAAVGGELIRGSNFLALHKKTFPGMPEHYWIGLTDLTHERGDSKSGWQWSDGAFEPASSELSWKGNWFQESIRDGVIQCYFTGTLCVVGVINNYPPVCQLRSVSSTEKRVRSFKVITIQDGLPEAAYAEQNGCSKKVLNVSVVQDCILRCIREPKEVCVAFYFNAVKKECLLVLYQDATMNLGDANSWKKFKKE